MSAQRLLVIDDDPAFCRFLRTAAEGCGYEVRATTEATAFKSAYEETPPDLIALDLGMPGNDGIELLRFLADQKCHSRILIVSGFGGRILKAAQRLGTERGLNMVGTIDKPVRIAELQALLNGLRIPD